MLRQRQSLALIGRADGAAVELVGPGDQAFVDEAAEDLTVLDQERHLVRAHFEHRTAAGTAALGGAKTGIEETGEMDAELADKGVIGKHLGGMVGRYHDRLAGGEDVEIVRVEHDPAGADGPAMSVDRLPEIARIVVLDSVHIDQIGVAASLVADDTALLVAGDIDGEGEPVADRLARRWGALSGFNETDLVVQSPKRGVAERR